MTIEHAVMPLGALIMCAACVLPAIHQAKFGMHQGHWLTYLGLTLMVAGGVTFVIGAGLMA